MARDASKLSPEKGGRLSIDEFQDTSRQSKGGFSGFSCSPQKNLITPEAKGSFSQLDLSPDQLESIEGQPKKKGGLKNFFVCGGSETKDDRTEVMVDSEQAKKI